MRVMTRKALSEKGLKEFGDRLRSLRKTKEWTQADLAHHAGIERSMVSNYESGLNYPPIPTLIKLAAALDITVDRLLGVDENRAADIQDRKLHQLFLQVDRMDAGIQGLVKQVVEKIVTAPPHSQPRTGTNN
jgi:transcriptional regulator with XRE-family HTH domain